MPRKNPVSRTNGKEAPSELFQNLHDILFTQLKCTPSTTIAIVYDRQSPLAEKITKGYVSVLKDHPKKLFLDYDSFPQDQLGETLGDMMKGLEAGDAVIMVQSTSFRVSVYRWRLDLFNHGLKVVEHMRLSYMPEKEHDTYIRSLKHVPDYYRQGKKLASLLSKTTHIKVESPSGKILEFNSTMEKPVINSGNYTHETKVGGGYPVGEVFSEAEDITKVNGQVEVYAFPGEDHKMRFTKKPFLVTIENGMVQDAKFPKDFQPLVKMMRSENENHAIPVREFGLGLNRAITPEHTLTEATAFERIAGLHLSLGMKHGAYQKKFKKQKEIVQRYHVDIYPAVSKIWLNDTLVFEEGKFVV